MNAEYLKEMLRSAQEAQKIAASVPRSVLDGTLDRNMRINLEIAKQQAASALALREQLRAAGMLR